MSVESIIASLNSQTEPKKWFHLGRGHTAFQGTISSDGFEITRIIHYRNSFLPIIRGSFGPGPFGTTIAIKMGLHPFAAAFMCFWFGGVGVGILSVLAELSLGQTGWDPMLLIPFGMLLFGLVLVSGGGQQGKAYPLRNVRRARETQSKGRRRYVTLGWYALSHRILAVSGIKRLNLLSHVVFNDPMTR
jgi:hypothetical protein